MIENALLESKEKKSLVGLNYYGSSNGFYCGYVLEYDSEFIMLQHYTKYGVPDGILIHKISDIKYLEKDSEYLKGIKHLIKNKDSIAQQTFSVDKRQQNPNTFFSLLESLIGNRDYLVKFELNDEDIFVGFVEWSDDDSFSIINIDADGIIIGKAIFKFEDVKLYWIDDLECRKRKLLYQKRNASR
jgi:hypothetical protein